MKPGPTELTRIPLLEYFTAAGGEGGVGPALAGGLGRFGSTEEAVAFVSTGVPGRMPGFETRLSPDEINAVVEFVFAELAGR